jgi:hypothetical protein
MEQFHYRVQRQVLNNLRVLLQWRYLVQIIIIIIIITVIMHFYIFRHGPSDYELNKPIRNNERTRGGKRI